MSEPKDQEQYEAPAIDDREQIDTPLVGTGSGASPSAAFHPAADEPAYEAPAIDEREPIDTALIGATSPGPCVAVSAAFHPADVHVYEPPAIVEREAIDGPLVAFGSGPVS